MVKTTIDHSDQSKYDYIFDAASHMCRCGAAFNNPWSTALGVMFLSILNEWEKGMLHSGSPVLSRVVEAVRQYRILAKLPTEIGG